MPERVLKFEIAIVGGGPAGVAAACVAAESGRRVVVVEAAPWLGGQIWRSDLGAPASCRRVTRFGGRLAGGTLALLGEAQRWLARFSRSGARFLDCATVI